MCSNVIHYILDGGNMSGEIWDFTFLVETENIKLEDLHHLKELLWKDKRR